MPVSNISVFASSWSNGGGSRWIGQRSLIVEFGRLDVERLAQRVEDVAQGDVADRHRDRAAGVDDLGAAHQAVGRLQRDGAHHVVADVLRDLEGERLGQLAELDLGGERLVELRDVVAPELDVDDRADDPDDAAAGRRRLVLLRLLPRTDGGHQFTPCCRESVGAADDLADFLGDLGLASLVRQPGVGLDQVGGVVARRLHRPPARRRLRRGRLQQRGEDPRADVARQQRVDEPGRLRLELVRARPCPVRRARRRPLPSRPAAVGRRRRRSRPSPVTPATAVGVWVTEFTNRV